jgi:hypothetical protein
MTAWYGPAAGALKRFDMDAPPTGAAFRCCESFARWILRPGPVRPAGGRLLAAPDARRPFGRSIVYSRLLGPWYRSTATSTSEADEERVGDPRLK